MTMMPMTAPPFYLRLNDTWLRLEGVTPGTTRGIDRPRSDFTSVDGYRYAQQAPRAAREWSLDFAFATPASLAALAVAAEAPGDVYLFDAAAAMANMLDPTATINKDPTATTILCGTIPLRALVRPSSITTMVRAGQVTRLSLWTTAVSTTMVATLTYPGGATNLSAPSGTGSRQATVTFTPTADGTLTVTLSSGGVYSTSGLQVLEGPVTEVWMSGERTPCKVAVQDAERVLNLVRSGEHGRGDYSVTLREVG